MPGSSIITYLLHIVSSIKLYFVPCSRSLDINLDNEIERLHAMRLIRKIMSVSPEAFPSSLLTVMVSIANDGNKERDKLAKACLASISEMGKFLMPNIFLYCITAAKHCNG